MSADEARADGAAGPDAAGTDGAARSDAAGVGADMLLATAPFLAALPADVAADVASRTRLVTLAEGDVLVEEGTRPADVFVVVDGELQVTKRAAEQDVTLSICQMGALIGELSLLLDIPASASVRAGQPSRVLAVPSADFLALLDHPGVARHLLRTVATRLANTQAQLQQRDKMAALGTMAAGLTHELNNPAAALGRTAAQLRQLLPRWQALTAALPQGVLAEVTRRLDAGTGDGRAPGEAPMPALDPVARGDAEEAVQDWLTARGVEPAWELAAHLVRAGFTTERLEQTLAGVTTEPAPADPAALVAAVAEWLAVGSALHALVDDTADAAGRVSGIVDAIKRYSHLDEAPVQDVDLHDELERTLRVLRHKLGEGITVRRDYATDLPPVLGDPVALNQVWTNLIDNAIDAMGGSGTLRLATTALADAVEVSVGDDGPGIPEHVRDRVFEPFVTTKPVGSGTGLGLHLVWDIVTRVHRGDITVDSSPAGSTFRVRLPVAGATA